MSAETIDDRILRFIKRELSKEGAYLLPLRLFIGMGWLRAFAEKVVDPDWLGGTVLAAFLLALRSGGLPEARTVAFASIVATQLAQTLDAGRVEGGLTRSVFGAVAGSTGLLLAALTVRPLRDFLGLVTPAPLGWAMIGTGAFVAMLIGRVRSYPNSIGPAFAPLPAQPNEGLVR
jgi:hypothetical protein